MAESSAGLDIARLVADHHQSIYRYAYRLSGSVPDAEDLTQQVFLTAQERLSQIRDPECARGWLFAILRNHYLKSRRRRQPQAAASIELDVNAIADKVIVNKANDQFINSEHLQAALDELDDEFKIVVLMFYFEYRTYREISELLELPVGTVMSRLARAKAHLRRRLGETEEGPSVTVNGGHAQGEGEGSGGASRFQQAAIARR